MCTFLQHVEKKYIHGYDAHKAFYQNCKIHGPWVSSSGTTTGPIWAYNEGILNHRTSSSLLSYICGKKINSLLLMNQWSPLPLWPYHSCMEPHEHKRAKFSKISRVILVPFEGPALLCYVKWKLLLFQTHFVQQILWNSVLFSRYLEKMLQWTLLLI